MAIPGNCAGSRADLDDGVGAVEASEVLVVVVAPERDGHLGVSIHSIRKSLLELPTLQSTLLQHCQRIHKL